MQVDLHQALTETASNSRFHARECKPERCSCVLCRFYPQRSRLWQQATTTTSITLGHSTLSCWWPPCGSWNRARVWRSPCTILPHTGGRKTGWVLSVSLFYLVSRPKVWLGPHIITLMCVFCLISVCQWSLLSVCETAPPVGRTSGCILGPG